MFPYIPCVFLLYSRPRIYPFIFLVYPVYIAFVPPIYFCILQIYSLLYSVCIPFVSPRIYSFISLVYSPYMAFVPFIFSLYYKYIRLIFRVYPHIPCNSFIFCKDSFPFVFPSYISFYIPCIFLLYSFCYRDILFIL